MNQIVYHLSDDDRFILQNNNRDRKIIIKGIHSCDECGEVTNAEKEIKIEILTKKSTFTNK